MVRLDRGGPVVGLNELIREKRQEILEIAAKHGAYNVRIFGSVARGEADEKSDVDILVELEPERSLLDLGGLLMDLEALLGFKVDVVTVRGLRKRIRERVLREAVPLGEMTARDCRISLKPLSLLKNMQPKAAPPLSRTTDTDMVLATSPNYRRSFPGFVCEYPGKPS